MSTSITHFSLQFCVQYCIDVEAVVVEINSIQFNSIQTTCSSAACPDNCFACTAGDDTTTCSAASCAAGYVLSNGECLSK